MSDRNGSKAAGRKPRVGVTIGDPAGIGPEVSLKAATAPDVLAACDPILIGDANYLRDWARRFGMNFVWPVASIAQTGANGGTHADAPTAPFELGGPAIYSLDNLRTPVEMGVEQAACGRAAADYIETAVRLCLAGHLDAIATAPINKKSLHLGGVLFPGHTEFLAHLTRTEEFAMTFFSPSLRVSLLTTHIPLTAVSNYVKQEALERLIRLVHREFIRYGFDRPRIAVAALNPHAGEGMLFGTEEATEMTPAINACRTRDGIEVSGPHSGDTIFVRAARGEFDVVISCYHDQGLIPVKCYAFGEAVNVTLGLPFIRTSVDHGTAFDIAGQNKADPSSMVTAIKLAVELYQRRQVASAGG